MKIWSVILFLLFLVQILKGQPSSETVEEVLLDLEEQYQVRFSYSKNIVPYDATVALTYDRKSLVEVLEQLGSQTGIIYRRRGSRVVLNFDPQRKASVENGHVVLVNEASTDTLSYSDGNTNNIPPEQKVADDVNVQPRDTLGRIAQLDNNKEHKEIAYQQNYYEAESLTFDVQDDVQFAQVSLIPFKSLLGRKGGKINHLSFNLLAGYTGGVQGLELGGYGNVVKGDVLGIQLSGFGNYVGGNVEGIQLAGFANFNQGIVRGFQLGGMANVNVQADAVQIAGAFNLNRRISRGYQLAGFFNAGRNITGGQLSGFFNLSLGNVYFQGSGFCNVAENVDVQISGLVNVAKRVDAFQIGLINIADSVAGLSFGLINLIKKGYNKIELSAGDALYGNLAFKLGTRNFYNIFQVGTNFKRNLQGTGLIWGYGYGFGFFQKISKDFKINPEVIVSNVQENRIIKPDLNLLNQFKLFFHFTENRQFEIFAGPTVNFMISNIKGDDGTLIGSNIYKSPIIERTIGDFLEPINAKFWIGFNAGIRI